MKGQLGIETIIAFTVLTFFLLMMTVYYISQNEDIAITGNYLSASKVCFDLKNAIDSVSASGNMSKISLLLPNKIEQKDYSFSIEPENRVVRITWDSSSYTCPIFSNVTTSYKASGLIGYWRLEEGSGAVASDSSSYGNDGTLINMNTTGNSTSGWTTDCKYGSCLRFDGVNDYVDTGTGASLNIQGSYITLEAWIKPNALPPSDEVDSIVGNMNSYALMLQPTDEIALAILEPGIGHQQINSAGAGLEINKWFHVATTFSRPNVLLYVNGVQRGSGTIDLPLPNDATAKFIGARAATLQYVNGTIDEVRIYNRALSADEIWQRFTSFRFDVYNSDGNVMVQRS